MSPSSITLETKGQKGYNIHALHWEAYLRFRHKTSVGSSLKPAVEVSLVADAVRGVRVNISFLDYGPRHSSLQGNSMVMFQHLPWPFRDTR